ncbi:MAG: nucleotide exchange factor GrpE [Sedimentisphaerales bacterium]|nr:nucleotide exchange factor GrpE [Sedimentisphaerales bacterium]
MKPKNKEKPKTEDSINIKTDESKELRAALENLQKEKDELFGKLQRVSADYANFQKRVPKQISDTISYEKERLIKSLLPAFDNFEHTLQNKHSAENMEALVKGIKIIYDQMLEIFKSHGVEQINAPGEKFNPAIHEAMMQKTEPEKEDNIVLEEFQKGYTLNGRVIRPSKVIVNKLASEQPDQQKEIEEPTVGECETNKQE